MFYLKRPGLLLCNSINAMVVWGSVVPAVGYFTIPPADGGWCGFWRVGGADKVEMHVLCCSWSRQDKCSEGTPGPRAPTHTVACPSPAVFEYTYFSRFSFHSVIHFLDV